MASLGHSLPAPRAGNSRLGIMCVTASLRSTPGDVRPRAVDKERKMMMSVALSTVAIMAGFCLGVLVMALLHIAKRDEADAKSFVRTAQPARIAK